MTLPIPIGYSTCPNDTFIFDAMVHGRIHTRGLTFAPVLADVETLNRAALAGKYPVTKLSFAALARLRDSYALLSSGAALGRGCGPLIVGRNKDFGNPSKVVTIAIPGEMTTARLLLGLYLEQDARLVAMPFEKILQAVADGIVDFGVIIHEGRFIFETYGLHLIQDLGVWWEAETGMPIPLGGIAIRRDYLDLAPTVAELIRESVQHAFSHPEDAAPYIRLHAQELEPDVVAQHIALYVNGFSEDLGEEGRRAVEVLFARAQARGLAPVSTLPVFAD